MECEEPEPEAEGHRESTSSDATLARNEQEGVYTDDFEEWGKASS